MSHIYLCESQIKLAFRESRCIIDSWFQQMKPFLNQGAIMKILKSFHGLTNKQILNCARSKDKDWNLFIDKQGQPYEFKFERDYLAIKKYCENEIIARVTLKTKLGTL